MLVIHPLQCRRMGSAPLLLYAVGLCLVRLALADRMGDALDYLLGTGNMLNGASSSQTQVPFDPRYYERGWLALKLSLVDICYKLYHLNSAQVALSQQNFARLVACLHEKEVNNDKIAGEVTAALTLVKAVGNAHEAGLENGQQCYNLNQIVREYDNQRLFRSLTFRRAVYDFCRTVKEVHPVLPPTLILEILYQACVCIDRLPQASTGFRVPDQRDSYRYTIIELIIYDYLLALGESVMAGKAVDLVASFEHDNLAKYALDKRLFQNICANLRADTSVRRQPSAYEVLRHAACNAYFTNQ